MKKKASPVFTAETPGDTDCELFSDGGGEEFVEGTGLACLANFRRAAAKLAWPPDMDVSAEGGVDSLLWNTGCNPGDSDVV